MDVQKIVIRPKQVAEDLIDQTPTLLIRGRQDNESSQAEARGHARAANERRLRLALPQERHERDERYAVGSQNRSWRVRKPYGREKKGHARDASPSVASGAQGGPEQQRKNRAGQQFRKIAAVIHRY